MRIAFWLLIALNLMLFLWAIFGPLYFRLPALETEVQPYSRPLAVRYVVAAPVDSLSMANRPVETEAVTLSCYAIGPFFNQTLALTAQRLLQQARGQPVTLRRVVEPQVRGYWVYLPIGSPSTQSSTTVADLISHGITDYYLLNDPQDGRVISVGVFQYRENAISRLQAIERLGYRPRLRVRYGEQETFWLDTGPADVAPQLLEQIASQWQREATEGEVGLLAVPCPDQGL